MKTNEKWLDIASNVNMCEFLETEQKFIFQACKLSSEEVQSKIEILQDLMSIRATWPPVEGLYSLGGFSLLLRIIAIAREWSFNSR